MPKHLQPTFPQPTFDFLPPTELHPLITPFATGLDEATRAIFTTYDKVIAQPEALAKAIAQYNGGKSVHTSRKSVAEQNALLAGLVREVANQRGWFEGWKCLVSATELEGESGMGGLLMDDISTSVRFYPNLTVNPAPRSFIPDITFKIAKTPNKASLHETGAKSLGGHNWESNTAYQAAVKTWHGPDIPMGPCVFFFWIGITLKTTRFPDAATAKAFRTAQILGTVDYDFDKEEDEVKRAGWKSAVEGTARNAVLFEGRMRDACWMGLLTIDNQLMNRKVQMDWVAERKAPFNPWRENMSDTDWAKTAYVDCAALAPFAYQGAEMLPRSRTAMFVTIVFANLHDFLYDRGCWSRISSAPTADAEGAFEHDLPQAWILGMIDTNAAETLKGEPDQECNYGLNALYVTCVWDIFNVRYRAWERFIKYTRLLLASTSSKSAGILKRAREGMVLIPESVDVDVGESWREALDSCNASKLVSRSCITKMYVLGDPEKAFQDHDFYLPELCKNCKGDFHSTIHQVGDEIQAIPGLPNTIITSQPLTLAAAIRRGALWAATSKDCCDSCAATIGLWANDMSDKAVVALMQDELVMSSRDWLLTNYVMGCVAFSPLRICSILVGFDLNVDIEFEEGGMGERDVVDC